MYQSSVVLGDGWRKFLPTDATAIHWYDTKAFRRLVYAYIGAAERGGRDLPLREFVRQFRGLGLNAPAKLICDAFPNVRHLSDLTNRDEEIIRLHKAMKVATKPPSENVLGLIGRDHLVANLDRRYGVKRSWYQKVADQINDVPFVFEIAIAETERPGRLSSGVNFSPSFEDPFAGTMLESKHVEGTGLTGLLHALHAYPKRYAFTTGTGHKLAIAAHLIWPGIQVLDRGKTRVVIPQKMADQIADAVWKAAKTLYQEEARKRDAARAERAERQRQREVPQYNLRRSVFAVLPKAVEKGTDGGRLPIR